MTVWVIMRNWNDELCSIHASFDAAMADVDRRGLARGMRLEYRGLDRAEWSGGQCNRLVVEEREVQP